MDVKKIVEIRKEAEKAVEGMPEGDLKIKAFEVIFNRLISEADGLISAPAVSLSNQAISEQKEPTSDKSLNGRILVLRNEGFFKIPKGISEIKEELSRHGWHYPPTTLSGNLQQLAQKSKLRRQRMKEGNSKIYKYSNP